MKLCLAKHVFIQSIKNENISIFFCLLLKLSIYINIFQPVYKEEGDAQTSKQFPSKSLPKLNIDVLSNRSGNEQGPTEGPQITQKASNLNRLEH